MRKILFQCFLLGTTKTKVSVEVLISLFYLPEGMGLIIVHGAFVVSEAACPVYSLYTCLVKFWQNCTQNVTLHIHTHTHTHQCNASYMSHKHAAVPVLLYRSECACVCVFSVYVCVRMCKYVCVCVAWSAQSWMLFLAAWTDPLDLSS